MRPKLSTGAAALIVVACAILVGGRPASASPYYSASTYYSASMYYPWAGQFPWDRPGKVNADVISGPLLSTSTHWPALTDYGFYRPTFVPGAYPCRRGACQGGERW